MTRSHTHPCGNKDKGCRARVECDGTYEFNYDGWPEAVCRAYHGVVAPALCEDCQTREGCGDCGRIDGLGPHDADCDLLTTAAEAGPVARPQGAGRLNAETWPLVKAPGHLHFCATGCGHYWYCTQRDGCDTRWTCPTCDQQQLDDYLTQQEHTS